MQLELYLSVFYILLKKLGCETNCKLCDHCKRIRETLYLTFSQFILWMMGRKEEVYLNDVSYYKSRYQDSR